MKIEQTNLTTAPEEENIQEETISEENNQETVDAANPDKKEVDLENMTPEELITYWKSLYSHVYLSIYDEQEFVWHKINRQDYAEIMDNVSENDKDVDEVVEQRQFLTLQYSLLSPDKKFLPEILADYPGILTSLTAEILKKSGFSKPLTIEV